MQLRHPVCAGLDVHKDVIVACRRVDGPKKVVKEVESFGTTTPELLRLSSWLKEVEVKHVVMESTGVFWKPVWNILGEQHELILANPLHVRNVPGRKSDVKDAEWLAELLAHGLVEASFVPDAEITALRDLTRTHKQYTRERVQHVQRLQKLLQASNIRLDSVISDIVGQGGRKILEALVAGETDPHKLAPLAPYVRAKRSELIVALQGRITPVTRGLMRDHLDTIDHIDKRLLRIEAAIDEALVPFADAVELLKTIPGIGDGNARTLIAELGVDMSRFKTAAHLRSWAGMCPRLDTSAGKKHSSKLRKGNKWLKTALCQAAWAAIRRAERGYFHAQYHRIKARRGQKKALMAVGASILTAVHAILSTGQPYRDLGHNHFDKRSEQKKVQFHTKRLKELGYEVDLRRAA
jgi:transposase